MTCLCTGRTDIVCNEKQCDIAGPGEEFNPNQCRICWLRLGKGPYQSLPKRNIPCLFLGEPTGELVECRTCAGSVKIKLHECKIHTRCSPNKQLHNIACCATCRDYSTVLS